MRERCRDPEARRSIHVLKKAPRWECDDTSSYTGSRMTRMRRRRTKEKKKLQQRGLTSHVFFSFEKRQRYSRSKSVEKSSRLMDLRR